MKRSIVIIAGAAFAAIGATSLWAAQPDPTASFARGRYLVHISGCNDCHTPPGLVPKYATKALNGWNHSFAFTTGRFPDPIRITERNRQVTEAACRKCHEPIVEQIDRHGGAGGVEALACITCHRNVGHLH